LSAAVERARLDRGPNYGLDGVIIMDKII